MGSNPPEAAQGRWRGLLLAVAGGILGAAVATGLVLLTSLLEDRSELGAWREVVTAGFVLVAGLGWVLARFREQWLPQLWPRPTLFAACAGGALVLAVAASALGPQLGRRALEGVGPGLALALVLALVARFRAQIQRRRRAQYVPVRALFGFCAAVAACASAARDVGFRGEPSLVGAIALAGVALGASLGARRRLFPRTVYRQLALVAVVGACTALLLRSRHESLEEYAVLGAALSAGLMLLGASAPLFADVSGGVLLGGLVAAAVGNLIGHALSARMGSPVACVLLLAISAAFSALTAGGLLTGVAALACTAGALLAGSLGASRSTDVLFHKEGRAVSVEIRRLGDNLELRVDREVVARRERTAGCDRDGALLGLLGHALANEPRELAVLGGDVPDALRVLVRVPTAAHVDLVEPEPTIARAARAYIPEKLNGRYADRSVRFGRALDEAQGRYDVVVGAARHTRIRGLMERLAGAVHTGGTVALLVPVGPDTADTVAAFSAAFHDAHAFAASQRSLVVLATKDAPTVLSASALGHALSVPAVGALARCAGVTSPDEIAALYLFGPRLIPKLARGPEVRGLKSLLGTAAESAALDLSAVAPADHRSLLTGATVRLVDQVEQGLVSPYRATAAIAAARTFLVPADRARLEARLLQTEGHTAEAKQMLEDAARIAPEDIGLARDLGHLYERQGEWAQARGHLGRAFARSGEREDRLAFARALVGEADPTARRHLEGLLAEDRSDPRPLLLLGRLDALEERDADAEKNLQAYLKLVPEDDEGHIELAILLRRLGRVAEARDHFQIGARMAERGARSSLETGIKRLHEGDPRAAIAQLKRSIERDRQNPTTYRMLALAYGRLGRKIEAQQALDTYLEKTGSSAEARAFVEELKSQFGQSAD